MQARLVSLGLSPATITVSNLDSGPLSQILLDKVIAVSEGYFLGLACVTTGLKSRVSPSRKSFRQTDRS